MSEEEAILSDEEKDALAEENATDEDVRLVDFSNQERVVRSQFPVLERIHERFADKVIDSLYNFLGRDIDVIPGDLHIEKIQRLHG